MKFKDIIQALTEAGETKAVEVVKELKAKQKRLASQRRANSSRKMSAQLKDEIWELHCTTNMTNSQIAALLNVNQGRVSEVIQGRRRDPRYFD